MLAQRFERPDGAAGDGREVLIFFSLGHVVPRAPAADAASRLNDRPVIRQIVDRDDVVALA